MSGTNKTNEKLNELIGDNTKDIQSLVDYLDVLGGGTLILKKGIYNQSSNIVVPSEVRIVGVGSGGTIIDFGNSPYQIQVVGSDPYATGTVSITSGTSTVTGSGTVFTIDMIGQSIYLSGQWYEISDVPDEVTLTLSLVYGSDNISGEEYAIATPSTSVVLQGFTVQNSTTDAILVQYATNFSSQDIASVDCLGAGMKIDYCAIFNCNVNYANNCDIGLDASNSYGATVSNSFMTGTVTAGFKFVNVTNSIAIDSSIDVGGGAGYLLDSCADFGIDQYSITNITGIGMEITDSTITTVTNGLVGGSSGDGVKITNSSRFQFATAEFIDNGGYGINVSDAGSSDNIFGLSYFNGNSSGNFNDSGTNTLIRSNIGVADN